MEHDNSICPRCGESAGDRGFCRSCRSHIESLNRIPTRAGAYASDAASPTTQVLLQVMQLEEALAAVSKGISERIATGASGAAIDVDRGPRPAADSPAEPHNSVIPSSTDEGRGDVAAPQREVARMEDVLKVSPARPTSVAPPAAPEVEPARTEADEAPVPQAAEALSIAPPVSVPAKVAAQALREAFWFEQASAFSTAAVTRPAPAAAAAEAAPAPMAESVALPEPERQVVSEREIELQPAHAAGSDNWITAIFLLTLVALVMLLTGRRPRG